MNKTLFQVYFWLVGRFFPKVKVSVLWPLAISVHESANFTSNVAVRYNNLFGMNKPQVRSTAATGKLPNGLAVFRSKLDSIRDFFYFLEARELTDDAKLIAFVQAGRYGADARHYAKVAAHAALLSSHLVDVSKYVTGSLFLGVGGVVAAFAFTSQK
jgi:hypothetical protein